MSDVEVIHIAGMGVTINNVTRQRCAWCGAVIIDVDLANIAVAGLSDDEPWSYPLWAVGSLVACLSNDGSGTFWSVDFDSAEQPLPERCCGTLDPEVTK